MVRKLRDFIDGDEKVTEYTRDGVTVSHTVRTAVQTEQPEQEPQEPVETMEEKIARLEQQVMSDNLILMDALAMTYEEVMLMRAEMNGGTS